ncbi:acyltransferase family protein [Demequina sp. NBRC 110053]|uniref:acyltransferase family protein n=1 Tax=Demequina sp. NBRC 110053 TaxID=1570342 RepID=UPI000A06F7CA|nr:acyltransferase family protein [Demequina sp. NBRC 110053]
MRKDIQALRALAVLLVVVYHFWPHRLPGGYVGVDVFFVISGFLITSHLISRPVSSWGALTEFWARRVRRLIPASALVLVATLIATVLWMPETVRIQVSKEIIAASLYVENWFLYGQATDYLAEGADASPTQHYWSLSIEEQFYIVWPILLGLAVVAAARLRRSSLGATGAVAIGVVAVSLAWSIHDTATSGGQVYFSTFARMWELALGGLLAWFVARSSLVLASAVRAGLSWLGIAMIVASAVILTGATPFPGYAALLPTVGAALVILADADGAPGSPRRLFSWPAVQWMGDTSYSIYLWHWSVVIILPVALGATVFWPVKIAAIGVIALVAWASRALVEEPVRRMPALVRSKAATFAMLGAMVAVTVGAALWLWTSTESHLEREREAAIEAATQPCAGADALRDPACEPTELMVSPLVAADDKPDVYADECWTNRPFTDRVICHYGEQDGSFRVALYGNSHAGHWHPPVEQAVEAEGGALDTYLISVCYAVDVPIVFPDDEQQENCLAYGEWARAQITGGDYDVVVMSNRTYAPLDGVDEDDKQRVAEESYSRVIQEFVDAGVHVLVLRDTPAAAVNVPTCVAEGDDYQERCATPRDAALEPDPLAVAAGAFDSAEVTVLEVTDLLCAAELCEPVVGGLITYFDHGHMTKTYAQTLLPEVSAALVEARRG